MTLPSEGKSHQLHCDLPTAVLLMIRQETSSFLNRVKNHCAVYVIAVIWIYNTGRHTNKLFLRKKEKEKGKRVEIPVTLHLWEVTNASQQAERYSDQSHYLFHLFPVKVIRKSTKKVYWKLHWKWCKSKQVPVSKGQFSLTLPWYSQV